MNKYQEAYSYIKHYCELDDDFIKWPLYQRSIKSLKELVDTTKIPTLEEVKKEWESLSYILEETEHFLYIKEANGNIVGIFTKLIESFFTNLFINSECLNLITKTFRALGWEV